MLEQQHAPVNSGDSTHPAVVEVHNLDFSYGERRVLHQLSFSVEGHRIFGLLGPNGCGKTTLFRILCTLLTPSSGKALVAGVDVKSQPREVRRKVGVVFQSNSLDLELSARENLQAQGYLYALRGRELKQRIEQVLARFGLAERSSDLVRTLSGGMRRRLELAKGLLHRPQILLLDEPTQGLDPGARREFWKYLWMLCDREAMTILVTTHLMEEAEQCDQLVILNEGRLVASGSPQVLKQKIGGEVVVIQTRNPEQLGRQIGARLECQVAVINGTVRLELPQGHEMVARLMDSFPGEIESVTVGKPTLEDVFIRETGHRFWEED